jgi:flagellar hook-associated protein 3 FlgL
MNYLHTNVALGKNRTEMSDLQTQAASQKRINKPSDDPIGTTKLLSSRTSERADAQYLKNMDFAKGFLDFSDQSLEELSNTLMRAKELALSQANDPSASESTRKAVATEVRQLYNQSLQVANRRLGNRYIFGGYQTLEKPFDDEGNYRGDRGEMMIEVNKGDYLPMNVAGDVIFLGRDARRSGVLNSVPKDMNDLHETQTKELQDQQQNKMQNQEMSTSIRGPASVEGQASENKQSEFGDMTRFFEGENIFKVLSDLETSMMANDKVGIQESIDKIDTSLDQVVHARAKIGSRVSNLQNTIDTLNKAKVDEKARQSTIEDVDAYELFSDLSKNESSLKATMSTSAKILQPSLLDFLK